MLNMFKPSPLGEELATPLYTNDDMGLEAFTADLNQGPAETNPFPYFKHNNIVIENGLYYATIYVCKAWDESESSQQLAIWFASLKETDHVHLTLASLTSNVPLFAILSFVSAVSSTKATIDIRLDQIVADGLAYFYLLADNVTRGSAGAMFIPSYMDQREQDKSGSWRAIHDFYKMIVNKAVITKRLTAEEAERLHGGLPVVVPDDRFPLCVN